MFILAPQSVKAECVAIINDPVGALMATAHKDKNCYVGLILGKQPFNKNCYVGLILGNLLGKQPFNSFLLKPVIGDRLSSALF